VEEMATELSSQIFSPNDSL
jgi:DNA-binding Xre family transcriptional regulator